MLVCSEDFVERDQRPQLWDLGFFMGSDQQIHFHLCFCDIPYVMVSHGLHAQRSDSKSLPESYH